MEPLLTAVICTRNRARFLTKCIDSLLGQTAGRECYEILIVDNGSTDNTREIIAGYGEKIRSVYEPVAGLSRARNTGWQNGLGKYVGYIDDDAFAEPTWVESVLWTFREVKPKPAWVGGPIALDWETARPAWINEEMLTPLGYLYWGEMPRLLTREERLGGGNSAYPLDIMQELGGFDERLGRGAATLLSGEETELQKRIEARGGTLYYHPGMGINHFVGRERVKPEWFYRRYFWGGVSDYFMSKTLAEGTEPATGSEKIDEQLVWYNRLGRIAANGFSALGIFVSKERSVWARTYFSYVAGWISGAYRWRSASRKAVMPS